MVPQVENPVSQMAEHYRDFDARCADKSKCYPFYHYLLNYGVPGVLHYLLALDLEKVNQGETTYEEMVEKYGLRIGGNLFDFGHIPANPSLLVELTEVFISRVSPAFRFLDADFMNSFFGDANKDISQESYERARRLCYYREAWTKEHLLDPEIIGEIKQFAIDLYRHNVRRFRQGAVEQQQPEVATLLGEELIAHYQQVLGLKA